MPLQGINNMMRHALQGSYAVGYFESWSLESLQGVVDAAEKTRSPVIVGFNGDFLSRPERIVKERLSMYGALGKAAADSVSVPCGLIFNECPRDSWVKQACECGFNLVMPVPTGNDDDGYEARIANIVRFAHERGVAVEAELGSLPCGVSGMAEEGSKTDPQAAEDFVRKTGIDLLAISVGNVHIMTEGEVGLDFNLLEKIHKRVDVPLVLHGGSGIDANALARAISMGVAKVNYGTYLKQHYLKAISRALDSELPNPHVMLGMGGPEDVLAAGRTAVRDAVMERIELLGCCGKAE
tara:strand:+ start:480 stop:1367 length:888 start_codon:yes stop_codon:yes gene_type:complete